MPTRRIFELIIISSILIHPVWGLARLWAAKTLGSENDGTLKSHVSKVITVMN